MGTQAATNSLTPPSVAWSLVLAGSLQLTSGAGGNGGRGAATQDNPQDTGIEQMEIHIIPAFRVLSDI